jgi:enoyl reductase-like protein
MAESTACSTAKLPHTTRQQANNTTCTHKRHNILVTDAVAWRRAFIDSSAHSMQHKKHMVNKTKEANSAQLSTTHKQIADHDITLDTVMPRNRHNKERESRSRKGTALTTTTVLPSMAK